MSHEFVESVVLVPVTRFNQDLAIKVLADTRAMLRRDWAERAKREIQALMARATELEGQLMAKGFLRSEEPMASLSLEGDLRK